MIYPEDDSTDLFLLNNNLSYDSKDDYPIEILPLPEYNPVFEELLLQNKLVGEGIGPQKFNQQESNNFKQEEIYKKYVIKQEKKDKKKDDELEEKVLINPTNIENSNLKNQKSKSQQIKNKKRRRIQRIKQKKKIKKKKSILNFKSNKKFMLFKVFDPPDQSEINKETKKEIKKLLEKKNISLKFAIINTNEEKNFKKRKFKPDNIRKKIKARFLKSLRNKIQTKLDKAISGIKIDFFPQCFISDINKKRNSRIINKTLKELMTTDFFDLYKNKKNEDEKEKLGENIEKEKERINKKKYENNLKLVEYLEKMKI